MSDDDGLDLSSTHDETGVAEVSLGGQHQDGGDDDGEGGEDRSRHGRHALVRQLSDQAAGATCAIGFKRLPPLHSDARTRLAVERCAQDSCDVVARAGPTMRADLQRLRLRLLRTTPGVRRLDSGGLARVRQLLAAHMPRALARHCETLATEAAERRSRGCCMLVMHLLQLQVPLSAAQRRQEIACLTVLTHGH